ncbi:MAG: hypothetical protein RLZZ129_304 [Verrucomicrobiota bacterium]|jgi:uncharacterized membrane protein
MQPTDPRTSRLARQKLVLWLTCTALVVGAVLLLVLPVPLPWPPRIGLAALDLIAAATLWLVGRQHFNRRS